MLPTLPGGGLLSSPLLGGRQAQARAEVILGEPGEPGDLLVALALRDS